MSTSDEGFNFGVSEQVAAAWERYRDDVFEKTRAVSDWLVQHADPQPGQTVLELAAGPGETGFLAAERLGPDGKLISTDLSPGMVDAARRGGEARGLTNAEYRTMDAQQLDLDNDSVDGAISRFGVMLLPEPAKCVAEVKRVLRPGGRFAYAVWGAPDRNLWMTNIAMAVISQGHTPGGNPFGPGGPFSLADPDANRTLLTGAGFGDVVVEEIEGAMVHPSVDHDFEMQSALAGPLATLISSLSDDERQAIRAGLDPLVEPFRTDDGVAIPWVAVAVSATA